MTLTELVTRIAVAISEMEGYIKPGSRSERQNNPGNLRSWGRTPIVDGFANFPTPAEGWAALRRQVAKNVGRGLTLYEFFAGKPKVYPGYAPDADGNRSRHYAEFVASRVGIPADVPLWTLHAVRESGAQREE
jgi:hypothetical protein